MQLTIIKGYGYICLKVLVWYLLLTSGKPTWDRSFSWRTHPILCTRIGQ